MSDQIISTFRVDPFDSTDICSRIDELAKRDNFVNHPGYQTNNYLASEKVFKPVVDSFISACENFGYFGSHIDMWGVAQTHERQSFFGNDSEWHNHNHPSVIVSSVVYLVNPELVGTEFENGVMTSGECYVWNFFSPLLRHRPGTLRTNQRRYSIAADLRFGDGSTPISNI